MMFRHAVIKQNSDSLIDLLTAQCSDLERLLQLSREQAAAVENGDFEEVLRVVDERASLSERLEVFQRQVSELRMRLGDSSESVLSSPIARRTTELVAEILSQDSSTRPLLEAAKMSAAAELSGLDASQRRSNAYSNVNAKGLTYSKSF